MLPNKADPKVNLMVIKTDFLINDMLSPTYSAIRKTAFEYHSGLDMMTKEVKSAKEK
jgi:hypothetical protein